jgi:hypothetical protein
VRLRAERGHDVVSGGGASDPMRGGTPRIPTPRARRSPKEWWPLITRREKARQREADAELARLTLRAQLAVLGQQTLTPDRIRAMLDALADEAVKGSGHVRIQAARTLLDLIRAATDAEPTDPDAKPLESMTPEERIALYTRLLREEGSADGDPSPPALWFGIVLLVVGAVLAALAALAITAGARRRTTPGVAD